MIPGEPCINHTRFYSRLFIPPNKTALTFHHTDLTMPFHAILKRFPPDLPHGTTDQ